MSTTTILKGTSSDSQRTSDDSYVYDEEVRPLRSENGRYGSEHIKPPVAYSMLIYEAIASSGKDKVTLGEIYAYIGDTYEYYHSRPNETAWKNSIRHNLTMQPSFIKVARAAGDTGKGGYWRINNEIAKRDILQTQKAYVPKVSLPQFRKAKAAGKSPRPLRRADQSFVERVMKMQTSDEPCSFTGALSTPMLELGDMPNDLIEDDYTESQLYDIQDIATEENEVERLVDDMLSGRRPLSSESNLSNTVDESKSEGTTITDVSWPIGGLQIIGTSISTIAGGLSDRLSTSFDRLTESFSRSSFLGQSLTNVTCTNQADIEKLVAATEQPPMMEV